MRGIQPLNTPMRPAMWAAVTARRLANNFTWTTMALGRFANGPVIIDRWRKIFRRSRSRKNDERIVSVHANCNIKAFLVEERNSGSFLLHPPI